MTSKLEDEQNRNEEEEEVIGQMRGGLIFVKTYDRPKIVTFYQDTCQMKIWLEQPEITILSHGNLVIGFHQLPPSDAEAATPPTNNNEGVMYTFVYPTRAEVDAMYSKFQNTTADGPPRVNTRYRIYQFFAHDPEGRQLEFQAFLHPLDVVSSQV